MAYASVFKRYELKYLLTEEQALTVLSAASDKLIPDSYGNTTVRNVYYDTPSYRLIRASIEKPVYKEKLRVRCYGDVTPSTTVFVELKRKYDGVVYKRRLPMDLSEADAWLRGDIPCPTPSQISREIDSFLRFYGDLRPALLLCYDREAFYGVSDPSFRLTLDRRIRCSNAEPSLCSRSELSPIMTEGAVLMEIKCSGGIPLWLTTVLSRCRIYKTSFSKYGTAYRELIYPKLKNIKKEQFCYV